MRGTRRRAPAWAALLALVGTAAARSPAVAAEPPDILLVTVDTLRADRLGAYGYDKDTSPEIDELLSDGVVFTQARTVEPLTAPGVTSMITSLEPQEHAATRNGLRMRPGLFSFSKLLGRRGYATAGFVGNWTLRDKLTGLAEHFGTYGEILERKRWFGLMKGESTAEDLNPPALEWLDEQLAARPRRPFFLWVHYVDPHAPYMAHDEFRERLGFDASGSLGPRQRYDTEIAFVDRYVGRLVEEVERRVDPQRLLIGFTSDHGESLGEHDYWGHGRHLYEATLHIPMGLVWKGRLAPRKVTQPALILDLGPTLLGLAGFDALELFQGFDWTPVLTGKALPPADRVTFYQAHKGAVQRRDAPDRVRQQGLLEVARLEGGRKEIYRVTNRRRRLFDLVDDAGEVRPLADERDEPSASLASWLERLRQALAVSDELPPPSLEEEDIKALKALGYLD